MTGLAQCLQIVRVPEQLFVSFVGDNVVNDAAHSPVLAEPAMWLMSEPLLSQFTPPISVV